MRQRGSRVGGLAELAQRLRAVAGQAQRWRGPPRRDAQGAFNFELRSPITDPMVLTVTDGAFDVPGSAH